MWITAAVTAGVLTACSSAQDETPTTTEESGHGALAQCLAEHDVPAAPGPTGGPPPGVDADTWQQAMQACSTLAPGPTN